MAIEYFDMQDSMSGLMNALAMQRRADLVQNALASRELPTETYNAMASTGGPTRAAAATLDERELLARAIYSEAGQESPTGQLAVGAVIANRLQNGRWGDSLKDVIMAPGQFSAFNGITGYAGGAGANDLVNQTPSDAAYAAADAILSGQYSDPTSGALNYYNPAAANPAWGNPNWQRIGNHIFGTAGQ